MTSLAAASRRFPEAPVNASKIPGGAIGPDAGSEHPEMPFAAASVGTVVRPGRVRNRTKTETDEKLKKPADGVRKKSPPARKAPARGRYVDEYARPAI